MRIIFIAILFIPFYSKANVECSKAFSESETYECMRAVYKQAHIDLDGLEFSQQEKRLPSSHPHRYLMYSIVLLNDSQFEKAVFWYYAGKLRYEFYFRAHPELKGSGEVTLASSLKKVLLGVSYDFNKLVFSKKSAKVIDEVLSWDEKVKNEFTSKIKFKVEWLLARKSMEETKARISQYDNIFDAPDALEK